MARYGAMGGLFSGINFCFFNISIISDNGRVSVHNVATKQNGQIDEIDGSAYVPDPNYPGELKVEFPGSKYMES